MTTPGVFYTTDKSERSQCWIEDCMFTLKNFLINYCKKIMDSEWKNMDKICICVRLCIFCFITKAVSGSQPPTCRPSIPRSPMKFIKLYFAHISGFHSYDLYFFREQRRSRSFCSVVAFLCIRADLLFRSSCFYASRLVVMLNVFITWYCGKVFLLAGQPSSLSVVHYMKIKG